MRISDDAEEVVIDDSGADAAAGSKGNEKEGDALLDMLFDDAREDRRGAPEPAATPVPPRIPPPRPINLGAASPSSSPPRIGDASKASPPVAIRPPQRPIVPTPQPPPPVASPVSRPDTAEDDLRATLPADEETVEAMEAAAQFEGTAHSEAGRGDLASSVDVSDEVSEAVDDDDTADATPAVPVAAPLPSRRPPPVAYDREEDASAQLLRQHQRDAWVARAEWLRVEAESQKDAVRARTLVVVSELFAMAGEEATARGVAEEALAIAPSSPFAHRQLRGLASRDGNWASVLEAVDAETRAAATPEARCHGSLFGAEIARICLEDEDGAKKRVDQAQRVAPADPRPYLARFCEALAAPEPDAEEGEAKVSAVTKVKIPELPELGLLFAAAQLTLAHRGLTPATASGKQAPGKADRPPGSTYEALLRTRAAASGGDHAGTVGGLFKLAEVPSIAGGAEWLAGVLAAVRKETREKSVEAFRAVATGSHGPLALRALAARAIELGDPTAARSATEAASSEAFSAADRAALATLAGTGRDAIEPWLDTLLAEPELAPLASAASAAIGGDFDPGKRAVGGARARASTTLGRVLGSNDVGLFRHAVAAFAETAADSPLAKVLDLELDVEIGAGAKVARAITEWRDDSDLERERGVAGALIAEAAGEAERTRAELARARALDPSNEAVARALASQLDAEAAAKILADCAQAIERGSRAAVLLVEAAVRLAQAGEENESDALLRRALEADPELPLAHHLGERAARSRGDREALIEWVRARRDTSGDPVEQAHDLVREALLLSETPDVSAPLLQAALRARPSDVALREVYERVAPEPPADRAAWLAERAGEATGSEAARLWLDAALELQSSGDLEGAANAARQAIASGDTLLAPIVAYRAAVAGHGAGDLVDQLLPKVRDTNDAVERLEIYERLAELDERGRGDTASGLLWRRTILEETAGHLPTLRRVASTLIGAGRHDELEPIALDLARTLEGPESVAHAMLASRIHQLTGTWDETREAVDIAYKHQPRSVWALRQMGAHARARGEFALALECDRALAERTSRSSEGATLSLRAAQSAIKAGLVEDALAFLGQAKNLVPEHIVPHLELAALLDQTKNHAGAAAALEEAANTSAVPAERARLLYRAATLWHDQVKEPARAREALEAVAAIDPSYQDVFQRLQAIYVAAGARAELANLLERRLEAVSDPNERVEMEVLRGRALADVGDGAAAKRALAAALDANPDHVEALGAFADVCAAEEDWSGAEQAWIRLARLVPEPDRQASIYFRLGGLYDEHLPNPERAELAYQEILKHAPADERAREKLVGLYQKIGDAPRAIEQQTLLVNAAEAPEAKCLRTTQLAGIYETVGDTKKAEATLLQARKTWPKDDVALAALARFYLRNNQAQAANVLLDRAVADARRALGTGRFEPYLFATVAAVAELRHRPDAARVAKAAVASLEGSNAALQGAGGRAADTKLDDLLAPEVITLAFRDLLARTGSLLDTAVPFDLGSVRASPLPPQLAELGGFVNDLAASYGLPGIQVFTSNVLGSVCVPVSSHPPVLVMGHPLVTSGREDVRNFLVHRALKVLQSNAAAIARTAPIDLWPLIAAYLRAHNTAWAPQGVDQGKLTDFYGRITRAQSRGVDPQIGLLAAEVIGTIGNRASTLNTVINGWGNRAGLLGVGDLNVAITGIAWAGGHTNAPPPTGKDRMTWIGRNAEARELVVFSVSDGYADARSRLGLAEAELGADDLVTDG
jgi:tetratricopeptide (TPR) repeat protein